MVLFLVNIFLLNSVLAHKQSHGVKSIDLVGEKTFFVLFQVLNNIEQFLIEEEIRMIKQDQHCKYNLPYFHSDSRMWLQLERATKKLSLS